MLHYATPFCLVLPCHGRLHRIPRQGIRVSRVGAEVDAILRPGDFPSPNHSLVIGKKRSFAGDQLFHEQGAFRGFSAVRRRISCEMPMVVEHIRKDHCVPGRKGEV